MNFEWYVINMKYSFFNINFEINLMFLLFEKKLYIKFIIDIIFLIIF